jgi:hypothetical protein
MSSSPTSSASTLDFTNFTIKVARFDEQYPADEPDSFVVGFTVTNNENGRSMYSDTRVYYSDASGKDDQAVVALAWERVAPTFEFFVNTSSKKTSIIGSVFTPTSA